MHIPAYGERHLLINCTTDYWTYTGVKVLAYNLLLYKIDIVSDDEMYIIIYITSRKIMYIIYNDNTKQISIYIQLFYIPIQNIFVYVHLQVGNISSSILYHEINLFVELHDEDA